jgi:hypothetical protein
MKHLQTIYRLGGYRVCFAEEGAWSEASALSGEDLTVIERCLAVGILRECAKDGPARFSSRERFEAEANMHAGALSAELSDLALSHSAGGEIVTITAFALLHFPRPAHSLAALRAAAADAGFDAGGIDEAERALAARDAKKP